MATPQELIAADDARKAREASLVVAKKAARKGPANDNDKRALSEPPLQQPGRTPDGHLDVDGVMMPYWLDDHPEAGRATG